MRFTPAKLPGLQLIDIEPQNDNRGFFARSYCKQEFIAAGLVSDLSQISISFNTKRGTLRGMHFQLSPHEEVKIVRCTRGAIYDVAIDLRPDSKTRGAWTAIELTGENHRSIYIPKGFAHGFQTLVDNTEVLYFMSEPYDAESASGVRWNDPAFQIQWPEAVTEISSRDQSYKDFRVSHA